MAQNANLIEVRPVTWVGTEHQLTTNDLHRKLINRIVLFTMQRKRTPIFDNKAAQLIVTLNEAERQLVTEIDELAVRHTKLLSQIEEFNLFAKNITENLDIVLKGYVNEEKHEDIDND